MALFLRYCAPCNSITSVAERDPKGLKCGECGGPLKIVDAFALIPALGQGMLPAERQIIVDDLQGHDLPQA